MYTFIDRAEFTSGWCPFNTTEWDQRETEWRPSLHKHSLQQKAGLRKVAWQKTKPRPAEWCRWCSPPSATNAFSEVSVIFSFMAASSSFTLGAFLLVQAAEHVIGLPEASFFPQEASVSGERNKRTVGYRSRGIRKDLQREIFEAMTSATLHTTPTFLVCRNNNGAD